MKKKKKEAILTLNLTVTVGQQNMNMKMSDEGPRLDSNSNDVAATHMTKFHFFFKGYFRVVSFLLNNLQ